MAAVPTPSVLLERVSRRHLGSILLTATERAVFLGIAPAALVMINGSFFTYDVHLVVFFLFTESLAVLVANMYGLCCGPLGAIAQHYGHWKPSQSLMSEP